MGTEVIPTEIYDRLRKAVVSDVKLARREFNDLRRGPPEFLHAVLTLASRPGEGRVRQMIATTARVERFASEIETWLRQWLTLESDEFARSAITSALQTDEPKIRVAQLDRMPVEYVEAYRVVSDRLCHRVRNALTAPVAALVRLEQLTTLVSDEKLTAELRAVVGLLKPAMQRLSRVTEFDTGDGVMTWSPISIGDWLDAAVPVFRSQHGHSEFSLISTDRCRRLRVRATPFWLDTLFGNLWMNAVQAVETNVSKPCHISVELNEVGTQLHILIRDNGSGFTSKMVESVFRTPYSTKSETRGRGLLEVADAVRQLHGEVLLLPVAVNEHRIQVRLPLEGT